MYALAGAAQESGARRNFIDDENALRQDAAMKRRAFLLGTTMLASGAAEAAGQVTVIYIGGWDCPYCTAWKNDSKPQWVASELFRQVRYVEIEAPHLREAYREKYWPEELLPVLAQVPHKNGTPRWLVVKNGKIVANAFGHSKWPNAMAAARKAVG